MTEEKILLNIHLRASPTNLEKHLSPSLEKYCKETNLSYYRKLSSNAPQGEEVCSPT